jgi:hypothetical protein
MPAGITDHDVYFFDLRGYLHIANALSAEAVAALNAGLDAIPPLRNFEWHGYVHSHNYGTSDGLNLQQIYEAGESFEKLIDHPSWFEKVKYFVGGQDTFDSKHGPVFIDENFATIRGPGEAIGMHSGGNLNIVRCMFQVLHGKFHCNQINILMALTDIGPGDGATMLIPGSHKSNFEHPDMAKHIMQPEGASGDSMKGAIEVHMKAGDVLLFVDAIAHGSAKRVNSGERRTIVYRYGPSWGNFRFGYQPSPQLLGRLTPERRQIVQPQVPIPRPD